VIENLQPVAMHAPPPSILHSGAAASLLAEVADLPASPLLTAVAGAGGSGKTAMLGDLAAHYRSRGVSVIRVHAGSDLVAVAGRCVLLVDDANHLGDPILDRLQSIVGQPDVDMVVASRPWPQSPALTRLTHTLALHHAPVALGALTRDEIMNYTTTALRGPAPVALLDQVAELTGGMQWLVHRVVQGLRRTGGHTFAAPVITPALVSRLGTDLDVIDHDVRELLLAIAVGFDISERVPLRWQGSPARLDDLMAEARAAGLLLPDGRLVPLIRRALLETTPAHQIHALQVALVDTFALEGRSMGGVARDLARSGLRDARIARTLEDAADEALAAHPALASELYEEARAAGSDELATAARRAQAASARGELDEAGRIVDDLLAHEGAPDISRGADVAAAVWARRGMLASAADVYRWLEPARTGSSGALAAVAMIGAGDVAGADAMLGSAASGASPTLVTVAENLMAQGIRDSVERHPTRAISSLIRASDMMTASGVTTVPLPEIPAVLATLVALHSGELDLAESVVDAALRGDQGGEAARPRLLLLKAWTAMQKDRPEQARAALVRAGECENVLAPRDELLLHALEVGLARRADDGPGLIKAWKKAREGILHVFVDLFSLLPLGELVIAGARLRDSARLESPLAEAWALLARLGDPPLWSAPLHWAAVQAAILTERPADLAPHAAALVHASGQNRPASVLAVAGRCWISVLRGDVDVSAVEAAARGLASIGLTWDGSRLAGHAAVRADDRKDMARLLACARDLHPSASGGSTGSAEPVGKMVASSGTGLPRLATHDGTARVISGTMSDEAVLSVREREVARLVLEGKTYREIGEAIFISPRTAEHHIARMRRRLGVATRSELLTQLRLALGEDDAPAQ
jgi:DNA-binding CsgD family transcriptional regulator